MNVPPLPSVSSGDPPSSGGAAGSARLRRRPTGMTTRPANGCQGDAYARSESIPDATPAATRTTAAEPHEHFRQE